MSLGGAQGDHQVLGDLAVAETAGNTAGYFQFALRQQRVRRQARAGQEAHV